MKTPSLLHLPDLFTRLLIFAGLALTMFARSGQAAEPARQLIDIEAQFIRTTYPVMRQALKMEGDNPAQIAALSMPAEKWSEVAASLKAAHAEFLSAPLIVGRNGHRVMVESVNELRYPTEFQKNKDEPGKLMPASFETRNVGVTLEIEPLLGPDNQQIDLNFVANLVDFLGFIDYSQDYSNGNFTQPKKLDQILKAPLKAGGLWQPIFSTRKLTTTIQTTSGTMMLVGAMPQAPLEIQAENDPAAEASPDRPAVTTQPHTFLFITARAITK